MKRKHTKQPAAQVPAPQPRREVARLSPDPEQGLTLHQVKERQQNGWANDPVDSPTKTVGQIVRENVFTFFNFIFVVLAALLVAVGSFDDMLFLLIAVANTGIGIVQQLRSKQTVDKLNLLAAPRANVVREGNLISVPAAQLVRDDVAELASGDQIPADATVLSGQVQVNEALITGEADAITKAPGDELLSGAFVVSGRCRARLDRVGAESYAARLTLEAKKDVTVGKSEMMSSLDKLIRIIGILLIPIGVALFVKGVRLPGAHRPGGGGVHGGRPHRHDPRGTLPADQRGPGGEHDSPGPGQGAGPGYELHRDPGPGGRSVRRQDGHHHRAPHGGRGGGVPGRGEVRRDRGHRDP